MPTRLTLIRHGTTDWNTQKRYCGLRDVSLSREGKLQAQKLCVRLRPLHFDRIYVSDRKRAIQTAQIIFKEARITKIAGLKEVNFGAFEGLRHKEIMKKYSEVYKRWLANPFKNNIPQGESLNSFERRVTRALQRIIRHNAGKNVAIVAHGGVISVFIAGILKSKNFWKHIPAATSVTIVEYRNNVPVIKLFNCSKHLD
ncbi:MAG: histidine phosphatase family protein [Candidatus Omnitrophica bacterium]|nr:histidine phosphatase family protein [Candidatus Omnitrophota bacterium]